MKTACSKPGVQSLVLLLLSALVMCLPVAFPRSENPGFLAWYEFLGSFHPLFLHLPIGILSLVVAMELWAKIRGQKADLLFPLILNSVSALAAAVFGFIWYLTGNWEGETIENHLWKGLAFAALALWLPWIYHHFKLRSVASYYIGLVVLVGVMFSAAHDGGTMSHGDPLAKAPWLQEEEKPLSEALVYQDIVVPILETKCYTCHSESKRKGGLRLDSIALMLEGGDNDTALVPGDIHKSPLLTSIHLPEDDDMHMPPKEKPQVTERELAILEHWVRLGASDALTVAELPSSDPLLAILESGSETGTGSITEPRVLELMAVDSPLFEQVTAFNQTHGNSLSWHGQQSQSLRFSLESARGKEEVQIYRDLQPFLGALTELDLGAAQHPKLALDVATKCSNLRVLKLGGTQLEDSDMASAAAVLPQSLEVLVLHSTKLSDQAQSSLAQLSQVKQLYLWNTYFTTPVVEKLKKQLPECRIDFAEIDRNRAKLFKGESKVTASSIYGGSKKHMQEFASPSGTSQPFTVHTNAEPGAWVMVDCQKQLKLARLLIKNRPELAERAAGLQVEVSADAKAWQPLDMSDAGAAPKQWDLEVGDVSARYIRLKLPQEKPEYLHLQHISIYHRP